MRNYRKYFDYYIEVIKAKIKPSFQLLKDICMRCLMYIYNKYRLEEFSHALYCLCEMDINDYMIPRKLLDECLNTSLCREIVSSTINKQTKKSEFTVNKKPPDKTTIYPENDCYLHSPDFFYYKSKRESYKGTTILSVLNALGVDHSTYLNDNKSNSISSILDQTIQEETNYIKEIYSSAPPSNTLDDLIIKEFKKFYDNNGLVPMNYKVVPKKK
jgi:hypothetical protein